MFIGLLAQEFAYEHIRQCCNSSKWGRIFFVVEVKEKEDSDPILFELKNVVYNQRVEVFSKGGDGILFYQGRLCVSDMCELRQHILAEAHNTRYSIHPGATKMYRDLWEELVKWHEEGYSRLCE